MIEEDSDGIEEEEEDDEQEQPQPQPQPQLMPPALCSSLRYCAKYCSKYCFGESKIALWREEDDSLRNGMMAILEKALKEQDHFISPRPTLREH